MTVLDESRRNFLKQNQNPGKRDRRTILLCTSFEQKFITYQSEPLVRIFSNTESEDPTRVDTPSVVCLIRAEVENL
jgi:hypothetical protein